MYAAIAKGDWTRLLRTVLASDERQRMELLGDAILDFVVAEEFYRRRWDWTEAQISQARETVVQKKALARAACRIGLDRLVSDATGFNAADLVEALIAAVYLEDGLDGARRFVLDLLRPEIERTIAGHVWRHPKTELLELAQKKWHVLPQYRVVEQGGGVCRVHVIVGPITAEAIGPNRREAEAAAAKAALEQLGEITQPTIGQ